MRKKWAVLALAALAAVNLRCMPVLASEDKSSTDYTGIMEQVKGYLGDVFEDIDSETANEVFSFLKEKTADGSLKTEEGIREAVQEGEEKFGVEIDEKNIERLVDTMEKLEDVGFSAEHVIDKTEELYQKYGSDLKNHADEIITEAVKDTVKNTATNAIKNFFMNLKSAISNFWKSLFH